MYKKEEINITLKLKEIDQLDSAILQFSNNTIAIKKLCASILVAVITIILKINENKIDNSIYISSVLTFLIFWFIDANSYYYQKKLRVKMSMVIEQLTKNEIFCNGFEMPLNKKNNLLPKIKKHWDSFFNWSQLFYILGIIITIILFNFRVGL